jgi:hypothetical protein
MALLIYDSFYPLNDGDDAISHITKMMAANPESVPLQFCHKEILKIAGELYDNLLLLTRCIYIYFLILLPSYQRTIFHTTFAAARLDIIAYATRFDSGIMERNRILFTRSFAIWH